MPLTPAKELVLKECFQDPILDVMNFLNEVVLNYPKAISFAPGRPLETFFDVEAHVEGIREFIAVQATLKGISTNDAWGQLGQYNRTNGIINELVAKQLALDEGIDVAPESIMVTVGAQEAMAIVLAGLFDAARDILLVSDPTYIGITGLARVLGIRIFPVASGPEGLDPATIRRAIEAASRMGRVRAIYDIPDFNNPLGVSLPRERRDEVLEICRESNMLFLEDNAYGMFVYDGDRLPTLKSLDRYGTVIYIGSFAKTLFPGLRLGYLVADQQVRGSDHTLAQELSKVKSLITVNTPPLCQAVAATALQLHGNSLKSIVAPKCAQLHRNRDVMLEELSRHFGDFNGRVEWNRPHGGFYLTMSLPFEFGSDELRHCADHYGVIPCPMRLFALQDDRRKQIRLAFSYVSESQIREGIKRLAQYCRERN